jgi:hypothetical protein
LPPLCAIAPALDSAKAVANVIVETFIVNFSFGRWMIQITPSGAQGQLTWILKLAAHRECRSGYPAFAQGADSVGMTDGAPKLSDLASERLSYSTSKPPEQ